MKTVHIFDIDSTIADNSARQALLKLTCTVCLSPKPREKSADCPTCKRQTQSSNTQEDWDMFFDPELVIKDTVCPGALEYAEKLRAAGQTVHFVTGRSEVCRPVTERWLNEKFGRLPPEQLIMRSAAQDGIPASQYKEAAWLGLQSQLGECFPYFYEDDPHVLPMYARYGIVVQCPEAWQYLMPAGKTSGEKSWTIL